MNKIEKKLTKDVASVRQHRSVLGEEQNVRYKYYTKNKTNTKLMHLYYGSCAT